MAGRSQIENIKEKLDIVEIAHKYIQTNFKHSGLNTFTLCPFHNEKSPSFSLNSEIGIYKCFGCGESGDVISLIGKLEGVDFSRALEIAAEYAGVQIQPTMSHTDHKLKMEKDRAYEIIEATTRFFHYLLMKHKSGSYARSYVHSRKIRESELETFNIGFAPNGFNNLKNLMLKKGYTEKELIKYGLLTKKKDHIYDKFRNRLMFPIADHMGRIVGFSGRTLDKDGVPKYLNSPETILYKKSNVVYGLYEAKEAIRKNGFAIFVEGNVEPLVSRKANIDNVVAPMGTSLTNGQLKLLHRYTSNIYFAFDTDSAGFKALQRNSILALKAGFTIKVINLGKFKDPDEMITKDIELWKTAVDNAVDLVDYLIVQFKRELDLYSATDKSKLVSLVSPFIALLPDDIQIEHYIHKLSNLLKVSIRSIKNGVQIRTLKIIPHKVIEKNIFVSKYEDYLLSLLLQYQSIEPDITKLTFNKTQEQILRYRDMANNSVEIRSQLSKNQQVYFDNIVMMNVPQFDKGEAKIEINKTINKLIALQTKSKISLLKEKIHNIEESGGDIDQYMDKMENLRKILIT